MSLKYLWNKLEDMNSLEQEAYIKNILEQYNITPILPVASQFINLPGKEAKGKNPLGYLVMHLTKSQLAELIPEYFRQLLGDCYFQDWAEQKILMLIGDTIENIQENRPEYIPLEDIDTMYDQSNMLEVFKFGVGKYEPWSFLKLNPYQLVPALFRHLYKHYYISQIDEETGLPHMVHAACNLRMIQLILEHKGIK